MIEGLKPYSEYKDSGQGWLGKVPAHWDLKPGHSAFTKRKRSNVGLKENTVLSLSYGRIKVKPTDKQHGLVPESYETYQIVDEGNIIIRGTDLQNDHTSLRIGLSRNRGIISSAYLCLEARETITPDYGYQILNTFDLTKAIYRYGSGLRQNLDHGEIKRLPIFLPPLDEQLAIVRFLDHANRKIDGFIRAKRKLIGLLNEQKQAIIHRAVTRGLDPNAKLKPSGIPWLGEIPAHWEMRQVKRVASFVTSGSRGWADYYSDDGLVFIQSGNLGRNMALNFSRIQYVRPPSGAEGERTRVCFDDILVCITGALTGNVVHVDQQLPGPSFINQHVALVRPRTGIVFPRFLAYALRSETGQSQFKTSEYGGTKQGLGLGDVKDVFFPLPSMAEQKAIVEHVDSSLDVFTTAIARTEREIALMQEYRTRLTADIVTGKLDVREAAAKLPEEKAEEIVEADLSEDETELEEIES